MNKIMTANDYVSRAIAKDPRRPNLARVYRDKTYLVASDGCRLHMAKGLPKVEKGYFLDGYDGQFPDISKVFPKDVIRTVTGNLSATELKALRRLSKSLFDRACMTRFTFTSGNGLRLDAKERAFGFSANLSCFTGPGHEVSLFLNLGYFLDAVEGLKTFDIALGSDGLAPFGIASQVEGREVTAVLMPMREPAPD